MHVRGIIEAWRRLGHDVLPVNMLGRQAFRLSKRRKLVSHLPRMTKELVLLWTDKKLYHVSRRILSPPCNFIYARNEHYHSYPVKLANEFAVPLILEVNSPTWEMRREGKATPLGNFIAN